MYGNKLDNLLKYDQISDFIMNENTLLSDFKARQYGFKGQQNDKILFESLFKMKDYVHKSQLRLLIQEEKERIKYKLNIRNLLSIEK